MNPYIIWYPPKAIPHNKIVCFGNIIANTPFTIKRIPNSSEFSFVYLFEKTQPKPYNKRELGRISFIKPLKIKK